MTDLERDVMADPAVHNWVKEQTEATRNHDPLDALYDAKLLVDVLQARWNVAHGEAKGE